MVTLTAKEGTLLVPKSGADLKEYMRMHGVTAEELGEQFFGNPKSGRQGMSVVFRLPEDWFDVFAQMVDEIHDKRMKERFGQ